MPKRRRKRRHRAIQKVKTIMDKRVLNKFLNILPKKYHIFSYIKKRGNYISALLYIANSMQDLSGDNKLDLDKIVGYISIIIDITDKNLTILFIHTNKRYRRNGIGKYLLILAAEYANKYKVKSVELDDDSDFAWDMKKNMYVSLGMKYINDSPEPEMEGELDTIRNNWSKFKNEYVLRKFFTKT